MASPDLRTTEAPRCSARRQSRFSVRVIVRRTLPRTAPTGPRSPATSRPTGPADREDAAGPNGSQRLSVVIALQQVAPLLAFHMLVVSTK
jgi:hypothetical protein